MRALNSQHAMTRKNTRNYSSYSEFRHLLPKVMTVLESMNRAGVFGAVLKAIVFDNVLDNIALHLLLAVGTFLKQSTCHGMRYRQTSKHFWLAVSKLFNHDHGRLGLNTNVVKTINME